MNFFFIARPGERKIGEVKRGGGEKGEAALGGFFGVLTLVTRKGNLSFLPAFLKRGGKS